MNLDALAHLARPAHLPEPFGAHPGRATPHVVAAGHLRIHSSNHRLYTHSLAALPDVARARELATQREPMLTG